MPKGNREPILTDKHRRDIQEALKWLENARQNCDAMHGIGFDQTPQYGRIEVAEHAALEILKDQFGE